MNHRQQGQGLYIPIPGLPGGGGGFPGGGYPGGGYPGGGGQFDQRLDRLERQVQRLSNQIDRLDRRVDRIERSLNIRDNDQQFYY
ncbi:hypothetical protein [Bacillus sp. ISL-37]|uniref:hypothetical protein n=1 Tax=Bacillus sp. ISL-37 TaxID=2819123 RepID=UPI00256FF149|nr:hypothetical protein [Bacillus sp. ISL-37]